MQIWCKICLNIKKVGKLAIYIVGLLGFCVSAKPIDDGGKYYTSDEIYLGSVQMDCVAYISDSVYRDCMCNIYEIDLVDDQGTIVKIYYDTVCYKEGVKYPGRVR